MKQAGIKNLKYIEWYRDHTVEDDIKLLKWSDEVLKGKGFVDWHSYNHPQLGKVELGGWDFLHMWLSVPHDPIWKRTDFLFQIFERHVRPHVQKVPAAQFHFAKLRMII